MDQHDKFLEDRGRSLEDAFFHEQNTRSIEKLRQIKQMKETKQALAEASGITDEALLERLVKLSIEADTMTALTLVPLVEVAWADGYLDEPEKQAILMAAEKAGFEKGAPGYELLESWLQRAPEKRLRRAWRGYIQGLCEQLDQEGRDSLKSDLLGRARAVAETSGGYLSLIAKVSDHEEKVLEDLAQAFPRD